MHEITRANARNYCRTCLLNFNNLGSEENLEKVLIVECSELLVWFDKFIGAEYLVKLEKVPEICYKCFQQFKSLDNFQRNVRKCAKILDELWEMKTKFEDLQEPADNTEILGLDVTESISETCYDNTFFDENTISSSEVVHSSLHSFGTPLEHKLQNVSLTTKTKQPAAVKKPKTKRIGKGSKNIFKCPQCKHGFAYKITLDAHIRKIHEGSKRPFKCDKCDKAYSFVGGLYTHIKEIHEVTERKYYCNEPGCERTYTSFVAMQKHKRLKHTEDGLRKATYKQYICEQCGASFNQTSNLKLHLRSKHADTDQAAVKTPKELYACSVCDKLFQSPYTLKYHVLQAHAEGQNALKFECTVCGRKMAKKFMLAQHMLVHTSSKLPCQHCNKLFVRKFELESHIKAVHLKMRPHQCQYCQKCFATRKTLVHHEYIHTEKKPYVCTICGQSFRQQTCLKRHNKSHEIVTETQ